MTDKPIHSGPQFWHIDQRPAYRDGFLACIICFSCAIALFLILRLYYIRENRRRDILQAGLDRTKEPDFSDLTDTEVRMLGPIRRISALTFKSSPCRTSPSDTTCSKFGYIGHM